MSTTMAPNQRIPLKEIDLSDPAFWSQPFDVREGAFKTLREEKPFAFFPEPEPAGTAMAFPRGPGYCAIVRYHDVVQVSRDPRRFCSGRGATTIVDMPEPFLEYFGSIINMDDPRHTRLRRIVSAGFTPRMLKQVEDAVQRRAERIAEDLVERRECDFVTEVAARLPLEIICDMIGIDETHHEYVFDRSNIVVSNGDPEYVPEGVDFASLVLEAAQDLVALMEELADARRKEPTDDLTSALVNANVDGEHLTHQELSSFFILLVSAGMETTRNAISHALWAFTEFPDQRRSWGDDFDGLALTAVEEIVRWASPIVYMRRTVTEDTVLADQAFAAGDKVLLFYNSANRDESVFADPYRFDLRRSPNEHVGFGAPGPHFCLGAHLARREIKVMWRELLRRVPDIQATAEPDRLASNFINGIKHLPCAVSA